ncbi:MAG: lamin tail domain-containing protein, partial [Caldilineaceae bacterium]
AVPYTLPMTNTLVIEPGFPQILAVVPAQEPVEGEVIVLEPAPEEEVPAGDVVTETLPLEPLPLEPLPLEPLTSTEGITLPLEGDLTVPLTDTVETETPSEEPPADGSADEALVDEEPLAEAPNEAGPGDGLRADELAALPGREVLLIVNGDSAVDLTDWSLEDADGNLFLFPAFTLEPRAWLRVWTLAGEATTSDLFWGLDAEGLWQGRGDSATLRDSLGDEISVCAWEEEDVVDGWVLCDVETLPEGEEEGATP